MATPEDTALSEALEVWEAAIRGYTQALKAAKDMPMEWLPDFVAETARRFCLKNLSDAVDRARLARDAADGKQAH